MQNMRRSRIFVLRTWLEERGENSFAWRAMVRDLHSGETHYFSDWKKLVAFVHGQSATPEGREDQSQEME